MGSNDLMAEKGFKSCEIKCSCGAEFETLNELYQHAADVHGVKDV